MVENRTASEKKISKVMREFKHGELRSGKIGPGKGPHVTSRKQAQAIALSEARKAGAKIPKKGNTMKKQSKNSRMDESLGMRRGKESTKKQSYSSRRKESRGMSKAMRKK
jgi:hypothetical protein